MLSDAVSYKEHMGEYHSFGGYKEKIKPVRTTDRTKAQIVEAMESGVLDPFIIRFSSKSADASQSASKAPTVAEYCGRDGEVCVWEDNGWEICAPCARKRGAEKTTAVLIEAKECH